MKRPRGGGWWNGRELRARHLPPGPKTPDELLRWEARAARALEAEPEALMRLRCHAMRGVCFYSSLSGADCAGEALERGFHGIFERVGASAVERTDWLQRLHTCDRAEASIKFLTAASKEASIKFLTASVGSLKSYDWMKKEMTALKLNRSLS